jgi:hypothetical protein
MNRGGYVMDANKIFNRHLKFYQNKNRIKCIWSNMKSRCYNPKNDGYKNYGARGIKICEEWLNPMNFVNWALENGYKDSLTIERKDVNKGYEPENCIWIPKSQQPLNTRKTNRRVK